MSELTNNTNEITNSDKTISGSMVDTVTNGENTSNIQPTKPSNGRVYNIQNLKPYNKTDNKLDSEEAKRRGQIGAKKSAEVRRQRKTMKETLDAILSRTISEDVLTNNGVDLESLNGDYTALNVLLTQIVAEGIANRDFRAAAFIRDTIGEQPKQEIVQEVITRDDAELMDSLRNSLLDKVM